MLIACHDLQIVGRDKFYSVRKHPKDAQETAVYPREIYFSSARKGAIAILLHTVVNSESLSAIAGCREPNGA